MNNIDMISTEPSPSWTAVALKSGVILGLISAVFGVISLLTASYGNFLYGALGFVVMIVLVVLANKDFKKQNGGYMSYGQGFKISFLTILVSTLVSGLITFIYLEVVDPEAIESIRQSKIEMVEKVAGWFGAQMPEEQMDEAVAKIEAETTPFGTFKEGLMGALFLGLILGLIIPAFTRRSRPAYD